ncbi:14390_t:CDS:2 [Rhizophagus irregularis]|nr:14390_t:CDS:2 [Rhizophagus irregularis]
MSTETQKYIGHETLVSYIIETKSNNWTYYGFLSHNRDIIITSLAQLTSSTFTLAKWQSFDVAWKNRFLDEANKLLDSNAFAELKKKNTKECDKENDVTSLIKKTVEAPANLSKTSQSDTSLSKKTVTSLTKKTVDPANLSKISQSDTSLLKKTVKIPPKNIHETLQPDVQSEILLPKKTIKVSETLQPNFELINFCYDILHELENTSYANLFYKCIKNDVKNNIINHPIDLFTINLNLENNQYTSLEDFEKDERMLNFKCDVKGEVWMQFEHIS